MRKKVKNEEAGFLASFIQEKYKWESNSGGRKLKMKRSEKIVPVPGKPGEFVVEGSAKAAKADKKDDAKAPAATKASAAAAGQKALPKTSAVK